MTRLYAELYSFPFIFYRPSPAVLAGAAAVSLVAALLGTLSAVRRAAALPPAEAMQPPAPPLYSRSGLGDLPFGSWFDQPTRIIFRQIFRWPLRAALTSTGIALAVAVLVTSFQWPDAVDHIITVNFFEAQHQDLTVGLVEAQSSDAVHAFGRMPGVLAVEPVRSVAARIKAGHLEKREAIQGLSPDAVLQPVYDVGGRVVPLPPEGLLLSSKLAELLDVGTGDTVTVEILEDRRPVRQIPVVGVFETYIGTPAYMDIAAVNRLMRERPLLSAVNLRIDPRERSALFAKLKALPEVSAVSFRLALVDEFEETMAKIMYIFISFYTAFACTLAFGVTYNSARIALSERGRELATLRVLGMSRLEISYILLGEIAILILVGLPLGCLLGTGLAWLISDLFETELFRVPMVIEASTYGLSVLIGVAATVFSAALVRRRLDRLDLIAVLKTRE